MTPQVMRDEHERHALITSQSISAAPESGPGWSRRARWSAVGEEEQRLAGPRSPARSSLAAACRPTIDGDTRRRARSGLGMPTRCEQLDRRGARAARWPSAAVDAQTLGHLVADRPDRIERWSSGSGTPWRCRRRASRACASSDSVSRSTSLVENRSRTRLKAGIRGKKTKDAAAEDRFAAAALADDAQGDAAGERPGSRRHWPRIGATAGPVEFGDEIVQLTEEIRGRRGDISERRVSACIFKPFFNSPPRRSWPNRWARPSPIRLSAGAGQDDGQGRASSLTHQA